MPINLIAALLGDTLKNAALYIQDMEVFVGLRCDKGTMWFNKVRCIGRLSESTDYGNPPYLREVEIAR